LRYRMAVKGPVLLGIVEPGQLSHYVARLTHCIVRFWPVLLGCVWSALLWSGRLRSCQALRGKDFIWWGGLLSCWVVWSLVLQGAVRYFVVLRRLVQLGQVRFGSAVFGEALSGGVKIGFVLSCRVRRCVLRRFIARCSALWWGLLLSCEVRYYELSHGFVRS
jgi:hypothetical protein